MGGLKHHHQVEFVLQVNDGSENHKDSEPLSGSILVEQKDDSSKLEYEEYVKLEGDLESPYNNNLPLLRRLLLLLTLSSLGLVLSPSLGLIAWPSSTQNIKLSTPSL